MNLFAKLRFSVNIFLTLVILTGCIKTKEVPSVTTLPVTGIDGSTATCGGEILNDGGAEVIARGICWSTEAQPTVLDNITIDGEGTGSFTSNLTDLVGDIVYYLRAYATNTAGTGYGKVVSFRSFGQLPTVAGTAVSKINQTIATLSGIVNANNLGTTVTFEYGTTAQYGNSINATEGTVNGGKSAVRAIISGLVPATFYHFRIKAVNALGTAYSDDVKFSTVLADIEGNIYNVVNIGSQVWMQENLRTTKYNNGDLIITTASPSLDISNETEPKYQWNSNIAGYGRFYTYYTATDDRGVCPTGWHLPADTEWTELTDYLSNNGYGWEGNKGNIAKSLAATTGWVLDSDAGNIGNDQGKNNSTGFNGFGAGGRYSNGQIGFAGYHGIWASSTESSETSSFFRCIGYIPAQVFRGVFRKSYGLSVRCLKN